MLQQYSASAQTDRGSERATWPRWVSGVGMDANVEYGASSDDGGVGAAACAADGAAQVVLPLSSRGTIDAEAARLMAETPAGGKYAY